MKQAVLSGRFWVAFAVCLLLFGSVCAAGLWQSSRTPAPAALSASPQASVPASPYTDEDARTLLLLLRDGDTAAGTLIRFDPAHLRVRALALPPTLRLTYREQTLPLSQAVSRFPAQRVQEMAAAALDVPIHHYAVLFPEALENAISYLGDGLPLTPEKPVTPEEADGFSVTLPAGTHTLTPPQVTAFLRQNAESATAFADAVTALCNHYLTAARTDGAADFAALIDLADSNIRIADFTAAQPWLRELAARNDGTLCRTVSLAGTLSGEGDTALFLPNEPKAQDYYPLFSHYTDKEE